MNCYETLFIVRPTLTEEEIETQIEKVGSIIKNNGGEIKAINEMGMRKLAYPIKKQERGYYSVVYYVAPPTMIRELEYQLRYNEDILRFMSVKYENKKEIAEFEKSVKNYSSSEDSSQKIEEETTQE
jgi:small subunit ribosomal protein S6